VTGNPEPSVTGNPASTGSSDGPAGTAAATSTPPGAAAAGNARAIFRKRRVIVNLLITVSTVLLVVGCFSVWANRLLFNPENWSNTSSQLLDDPTIRASTANYIVDQLYANVDVTGMIRSALPSQFQRLAAPAAGALRTAAVQATDLALQRPRVQALWAAANRSADRAFVDIVNGRRGAVSTANGVVSLDLGAVLESVAARLGLPADLSAKLPPRVATLTVLKSRQLKSVQDIAHGIQGLALWLTIIVPVLYALAVALAKDRRRALMHVGFAGITAGLVVILLRSVLETQVASALTNDVSLRATIIAVTAINTQILGQIAVAVIVVAVALVIAAWVAGSAPAAVAIRRWLAPFLREHPVRAYAVTLAVMILVFIWDPIHATGTPAGMIVFTALALLGTFVLMRQAEAEFPDAPPGAASQALRSGIAALRRSRHGGQAPSAMGSTHSISEQLGQLADLRDRGAVTPEEYDLAKSRLLR